VRVCIDARLVSGLSGGVESVVIGLAGGLSALTDGSEEYVFLTYRGLDEWLQPYVSGPCRTRSLLPDKEQSGWRSSARQRLGTSAPALREFWHQVPGLPLRRSLLRGPDPVIENGGFDAIHFPTQGARLTDVPSVYNPHDFQHLHYPDLFSRRTRRKRNITYRAFCSQAKVVAVTASGVKRDLVERLRVPEPKVHVIPWAPVLEQYPEPSPADLAAAKAKFSLPSEFALYPAQTWAHKNHIGLLEALALLRYEMGVVVPLVCTGRRSEFFPTIARRASELLVADQIIWLDFINPSELFALYKLSQCVIVPTKFEAASGPLWEAFFAGVPAACSNVTSLPEQAGDAALLFDPDDREAMAHVTRRLWTDEALRATLVERGRARVADFTWAQTARRFRARYRQIACAPLTDEDRGFFSQRPVL
jgi:glycosyltransferase involved in cell wall biosynthesis